MTLNTQQKQAVRFLDDPLLVLAGAGSGKTRVITQKIAYLIRECDVAARNIFAVTFTNKAAREMKERVGSLLQKGDGKGLNVSTFHNLGLSIVRREAKKLGYKSNVSIFDAEDSFSLIKEITKAANDKERVVRAQQRISLWKSELVEPQTAIAQATDQDVYADALVYAEYQRYLRAYNALDFDDLIYQPVHLFRHDPEAKEKWQNRVRYLLVDEYQDTNSSQYELIRHLIGVRAALTAVGDDDQSIYAWRGANPENMQRLQQDYPRLRVIKLEQNYRSSGRILKAANRLISNNAHLFEKSLWSELGFGDPVRVVKTRDEEHEAQRVVSDIIAHRFKKRTDYRDFAILYRGNHQSRIFEKILRENNVPYYLSGGTSFFSYSEIRDLMAYLRLLVNQDDDAAFLRVVNTPRREIGASTLEKLGEYAKERSISLFAACFELGLRQRLTERAVDKLEMFCRLIVELSDQGERGEPLAAVKTLLHRIDYEMWLKDTSNTEAAAERRLGNVHDFLAWMTRVRDKEPSEVSLAKLVSHMALMDVLDRKEGDEPGDRVHLMTLHAAKGLEFPHVFIVGMEEDFLPHRTSIEQDAIEEERRLAYVGITRAQQSLTFTYAARRRRQGELVESTPSRFLAELPEEDLEWEGEGSQADPAQRQERGQAHLANLRTLLVG